MNKRVREQFKQIHKQQQLQRQKQLQHQKQVQQQKQKAEGILEQEGKILKQGTAEELAADEQVRRVYLGQNFVLRKRIAN